MGIFILDVLGNKLGLWRMNDMIGIYVLFCICVWFDVCCLGGSS